MPNYIVKLISPISIINKKAPIEYKIIDDNRLKKDGYTVKKKMILPDPTTGYISDVIKKNINLREKSTEVLNIATGLGKTTAIYDLVTKLYHQKDAIIILATPFISLVDKDIKYLTDPSQKHNIPKHAIVDYRELTDKFIKPSYEHPTLVVDNKPMELAKTLGQVTQEFQEFYTTDKKIHVITVHSLLGNPGDTAYEQNYLKKNYNNGLIEYCKKHKKKVYLFVDEIHASIQNFENKYIHNLTKWKGIIHKCFISTATFTEPVNIVIKHLAYLTDDKINILENERNKSKRLAELDILFTNQKYSKNDLTELYEYIPQWLDNNGCTKLKSPNNFHILSYSQSLAKAIFDDKNNDGSHKWWKTRTDVQLIVSTSTTPFNRRVSNIGTKFSTGVNIDEPKASMVIIFPCRYSDYYTQGEEGIFSIGLPSILQSIARLRNGGRMLFVIPPMPEMIDCSEFTDLKKLLPEFIFRDTKTVSYVNFTDLNMEHTLLDELYNRMSKPATVEKKRYETDIAKSPGINRPVIQFPSYESFVLETGQDYLKNTNLKSGKSITPYVLWAALNDQFVNCTLNRILYYKSFFIDLIIDRSKVIKSIEDFLTEYSLQNVLVQKSYKEYLTNIKSVLQTITISGNVHRVIAKEIIKPKDPTEIDIYEKVDVSNLLTKKENRMKLLSSYYKHNHSSKSPFKSEKDYMKYRMTHNVGDQNLTNLYQEFDAHLQNVLQLLQGKAISLKNAMSNPYFTNTKKKEIVESLKNLKDNDPVLKEIKAFKTFYKDGDIDTALTYILTRIMKRGKRNKKNERPFNGTI